MTTQAAKKKKDKRRAQKRKHEHQTEHMQEEAARHKRSSREEWVVIIILVCLVPFLLTGFFFFPSSTPTTNTGIEDGTYNATMVSTRAAFGSTPATAVVDVSGQNFIINDQDFSGNATVNVGSFFTQTPGTKVKLTVRDGYITDWSPA
ncbi:MAG: hypothetical protein ACYC99_06115 [Candidatus Geothermincolia bacterium]